jgi:CubicO group peptidase (beta-lactamase class C family)
MPVTRSPALALLLSLALSLSLIAHDSSSIGQPDPRAAGMNPERVTAISKRMQEYVDAGETAGIVTIIARHDKVASFDAVGFQDIERKIPIRKDSLFRIASLTKPVTCAGIMLLVDEGKLSVIDPVEKFLPEYHDLRVSSCGGRIGYNCRDTPPERPINIEDLMTHTSGLNDDAVPTPPQAPRSLADLSASGARSTLLFNPGTAWSYSNIGYDVLGRIIEIVSKQPFDRFLEERLFQPLGMQDTGFFPQSKDLARLAKLYTHTATGLIRASGQYSPDGTKIPGPAGGLISSAADMFRFNLMMRNKGLCDGRRILSAAAVTLMTVSHTGDLQAGWVPGVGHGYGYEVVRDVAGMFRYNSIGTFVKGGAYRTYEFYDPEKDLLGIFMTQLTNDGDTADPINSFIAMSAAAIE